MSASSLWEDEWVRDVGTMLFVWFVAIVISAAVLIVYDDAIYQALI